MTINQFKFLFKSVGDQHLFIKNTQFGDPPQKVDSNEDGIQYPAFYQVLVDTIMRDQTIETTFTLIVADLVQPDNSNLDEVLSDTRSNLQAIITLLRQGGENFIILGDPQILPFKDRYSDRVTGHQVDVTIETLNDSTLCNIPFEDFLVPGQFFPPTHNGSGFKCSDLLGCQLWNDLVDRVTESGEEIGSIESTLAQPSNQIVKGTGTSISSSNKFTFDESLLYIDADTQITGLAGSGNRMVIASADGTLSTQAIPSSAALTDTYVGFGSAGNALTGSSDLTWNGSILNVTGGITLAKNGVPLLVDSLNGNSNKIGLRDGGVLTGYLGSSSGNSFMVSDGLGNNLFNISNTGATQVINLAGSGNRMVIASATGILSTQSIPSGASLTSTYVGYGDGSNNLTGSSDFVYNNTTRVINIAGGASGSVAFGRMNSTHNGINSTNVGLYSNNANSYMGLQGDGSVLIYSTAGFQSYGGALSTNYGTRLDANGYRIGQISTLGTSNTSGVPFEVVGIQFTPGGIVYSQTNQGFLVLNGSTTRLGSFNTEVQINNGIIDNYISGTIVQKHTSTLTTFKNDVKVDTQGGIGPRIVEADSTGLQSATKEIISAWVNDPVAVTELEDPTNWDITGQWLGTITNTYQSQQHFDNNYHYTMVDNNEPIRTPRA